MENIFEQMAEITKPMQTEFVFEKAVGGVAPGVKLKIIGTYCGDPIHLKLETPDSKHGFVIYGDALETLAKNILTAINSNGK